MQSSAGPRYHLAGGNASYEIHRGIVLLHRCRKSSCFLVEEGCNDAEIIDGVMMSDQDMRAPFHCAVRVHNITNTHAPCKETTDRRHMAPATTRWETSTATGPDRVRLLLRLSSTCGLRLLHYHKPDSHRQQMKCPRMDWREGRPPEHVLRMVSTARVISPQFRRTARTLQGCAICPLQ